MKFAVLDLETTGTQAHDKIIQIGLVVTDEEQMIERYTSLVNPGQSIPSYIAGMTGITDEMTAAAPSMEEVLPEFVPKLDQCVLVAHNAAFDAGFLQHALDAHGYLPFAGKVLDTLDLLRIAFPDLPSLQLSMVADAFGIEHDRPHQADSDAEVTAQIWLRCLKRLKELPLLTVQRLSQLFDPLASDLGWFFQQVRIHRELHTSLDQDAGRYYRLFALYVDVWGEHEELRTPEHRRLLNADFPDFYDKVKAALSERFSGYETRPAQEQMVGEVESSFEQGNHLLIEAGTGTGKSLGYLIPSLYYGISKGKKVVVSTHTINLQEQLRKRDVPLLNEIFPIPFKAAVLKGRSHYLCLRKFENKMTLRDFIHPREDLITAAQMIVWLGMTEHGDDEELHFGAKGFDFWRTVASDTDSCLNRACPWFKKCFYHRARNDANEADVVITNHSMLFVDTKAENRLLPSYEHLVIDEAHHFEEVAGKLLGTEVYYSAFTGTLLWLYKDSKSGLLPLLKLRLQRAEGLASAEKWDRTIDELIPKILQIKTEWDEFCELMYQTAAGQEASQGEQGQLVARIRKDALPAHWQKLQVMEDNIYLNLNDTIQPLEKMLVDLKENQEELDLQSVVTDLSGAVKNLTRDRDAIRLFMKMNDDDYVYWVEAGSYLKSKSLQLVSVPSDVSPMLQELFFKVKESIVMTSATLSVDKSFHYTCEQLGLDPAPADGSVKSVLLPSTFNYRQQALVCIPRDFPSIKGYASEAAFITKLTESLRDVAIQTNGRMLVLFTSYRMLKQIHPVLKEQLEDKGIHVLGQGIDSGNRSKLTRLFQQNLSCVLLGTSSFWEGVDIPGDALSCLAIVRLPFQPPTHPLVEAKCEIIKKNKQNPFMKLSVPQAVIRFKQGFGRLVRTARDKGVVIIYDTRVIDTTYGKYFLYSLPGPKIEHMTTTQLVPRIKQWMEEVPR